MIRAASAGLIGVSMTGGLVTNRARAWCQRRGRQRLTQDGQFVSPTALSIYSNFSMSSLQDRAGPAEMANQVETEKWKMAYGSFCRDHTHLQNMMQEQAGSAETWAQLVRELEAKVKKIEQENADLKQHMDQEIKKAESIIEKNCHEIMISKMERAAEESEKKMTMLKLQVAKQTKKEEVDEANLEVVKKELEFQNKAYQQTEEQALQSELRTRVACSASSDNAMQCYIGSVDSIQTGDKYTDQQVELIIEHEIEDKFTVVLCGYFMCTKDALLDVGQTQRRRALTNINAKRAQFAVRVDENYEKIFDEVNNIGSQRQHNHGGSNLPTLVKVCADGGSDGGDDNDDLGFFAFSVIPDANKKSNEDGDGLGGNDPDRSGGTSNRNAGEDGSKDDGPEFQLVDSRNVEVIKFAGTFRCKITYIVFNDSMRKYIAIKGKDGEILNKILIGAEKRGDEPIIDDLLQPFFLRKHRNCGNTIEPYIVWRSKEFGHVRRKRRFRCLETMT